MYTFLERPKNVHTTWSFHNNFYLKHNFMNLIIIKFNGRLKEWGKNLIDKY